MKLLENVQVINVGLEFLCDELKRQGISSVHVCWTPPAQGNSEMINILKDLRKNTREGQRV